MLIPVMLLTLCVSVHAEQKTNYTQLVKEYIDAWKEAFPESPPRTAIGKLQKAVNDSGEELLKLHNPVLKLIAAAVNTEFEPESLEQQALSIMHSSFEKQSRAMNQLYRDSRYSFTFCTHECNIVLNYDELIISPQWKWLSAFEKITDPMIDVRSLSKKDFISSCEAEILNNRMLNIVEEKFRTKCPIPNEDDIDRVIRVRMAFRYFESQFIVTDGKFRRMQHDYDVTRKHILTHMRALSSKQIADLISELDNTKFSEGWFTRFFSNERNLRNFASRDIFNELRQIRSDCLPEVIFNMNDQSSEALEKAMMQLTSDVLIITQMTVTCANISTGGDEQRMVTLLNETRTRIERIGGHMEMWFNEAQRHLWPILGIEEAKVAINISDISPAKYERTAAKIYSVFNDRAKQDESYHVFAAPSGIHEDDWAVRTGKEGIYYNITNIGGIDVHVFRYDYVKDLEIKTTVGADEWLKPNRAAIIDVIRSSISNTAAEVMRALSDHPVTRNMTPTQFRSAILFRNRVSKNETHIPIGWRAMYGEHVEYSEEGHH
ncbi:hypothetical protein PENTCL1PPCAC_7979, partial [Pristionchus entomophagus]